MPPFILTPGAAGGTTATGTRFDAAWRAVADQLGEWAPLTVAAGASLGVHPDADRQVLALGLTADGQRPRRLDGFWAYVVDGAHAGETRMVLETTYDGPYGSVLVDRSFADGDGAGDVLAEGTQVDLTSPLPVGRHLGVKGIKDCVREALHLITIETRLALVGAGMSSYPLGDYGYITLGDQVDSIWEQGSVHGAYVAGWNQGTVAVDGADLALVTDAAIPTGRPYQVRVLRPADTLVRTDGVWGVSATGPVNAADEVVPPLRWITAFGMVKALRACVTLTQRRRDLAVAERRELIADYELRLQTWAAAAADIKRFEVPRATPRRVVPLVGVVAL